MIAVMGLDWRGLELEPLVDVECPVIAARHFCSQGESELRGTAAGVAPLDSGRAVISEVVPGVDRPGAFSGLVDDDAGLAAFTGICGQSVFRRGGPAGVGGLKPRTTDPFAGRR